MEEEEEEGRSPTRFMAWAEPPTMDAVQHQSSRWGFFSTESAVEMGEGSKMIMPAGVRPQLRSSSAVDKLNPTLQSIFDWAEDQVDQNLEDAPILTPTDLDGLKKQDKVVSIYRRKQDLTVTLREDVWSAVAVFGVRVVRKFRFPRSTAYQEFLICLGHMDGIKFKWKSYKEIRRLSKLVRPLCLVGAIAVYNDLLKPTETIFADNTGPSLIMARLVGITAFVSQVLEEL